MSDVTFRDFAGHLMGGELELAAGVLSTLLGVDATTAAAATKYFQTQAAADPAFAAKAMGMRQVVEARDAAALEQLIVDCFGLSREEAATAGKAVLARYP